jgi:hypothetical protein
MQIRRSTLVAAIGLSLMVGSGCKKITQAATEKAMEEGTGAKKVNLDKGNVEVTGPQGQQVNFGQNVALPDGWPTSRVPQYPGSTLIGAVSANGQLSYTGQTGDAPAKVVAFYKDKLSGYKNAANMTTPQGSVASYTSDKEDVAISAGAGGDGKTTITVAITPHSK